MRNSPITFSSVYSKFEALSDSRSKDFWRFEWSLWFHTLAWSIISIFIPILLLTNGFSINEVLLFYVIFHGANVPLNSLARWLTKHHGPKIVLVAATVCAIFFFLLYASVHSWEELIVLALLFALYDALHYVAATYLFIKESKDPENTAQDTGIMNLMIRSAGLVGPVIGALLVLTSGGNRWISVGVVVMFFIFSLIPLLRIHNIDGEKPDDFKSPKDFFKNPREVKNHLSLALFKVHESVEAIILPILIFVAAHTLDSIALLAVLVPVITLGCSYFASHIKRGQREKVIIVGSILLALVWLLRIWIPGPAFLYGSLILTGLFALFILVPLEANMFKRALTVGPLSASMYKNSVSMGTKFFLFAGLYFAVELFKVSFLVAAGSLVGLALVNIVYLRWRMKQPEPQTSVVGLPAKKI